jgi:hypothetical protein
MDNRKVDIGGNLQLLNTCEGKLLGLIDNGGD